MKNGGGLFDLLRCPVDVCGSFAYRYPFFSFKGFFGAFLGLMEGCRVFPLSCKGINTRQLDEKSPTGFSGEAWKGLRGLQDFLLYEMLERMVAEFPDFVHAFRNQCQPILIRHKSPSGVFIPCVLGREGSKVFEQIQ